MKAPTQDAKLETKSHLRGSVLLVGGRVFSILVNFAVQIITVRYLTKGDYGIYAFATSMTAMSAIFCSFGLDKAASRYLAIYLEKQQWNRFWGGLILLFGTVTLLGLVASSFYFLTWLFGWPLLGLDEDRRLVLAVVGALSLTEALNALFTSSFAVLANAKSIFFRRYLLGPLFKLSAAIAVIVMNGGLYWFAGGQLLAALLATLICVPIFLKVLFNSDIPHRPKWNEIELPTNEVYRYSLTLLVGDIAFLLRGALIPVLIGLYYASEMVASYQSVLPVARLNEFVLATFSIMFLPKAAQLREKGHTGFLQELFDTSTQWIVFLSFPVFALSFLASDFLPVLLFGKEYQSSGPVLAVLAMGFYVNASAGMSMRLLRAIGNLRVLLASDFAMIGVGISLAVLLIPSYGAIGAAYSVFGCYVAQAIVYYALVKKTTEINPLSVQTVVPFLGGAGLCCALYWVQRTLNQAAIFGLVYAVVAVTIYVMVFASRLDWERTFPELTKFGFRKRKEMKSLRDGSKT